MTNSKTTTSTARLAPLPKPLAFKPGTSTKIPIPQTFSSQQETAQPQSTSSFTRLSSKLNAALNPIMSTNGRMIQAAPAASNSDIITSMPSEGQTSRRVVKQLSSSSSSKRSPKSGSSRNSALASALRTPNRARAAILAVGVAAIVISGTWFGADLKISRDEEKAREAVILAGNVADTAASSNNAVIASQGADSALAIKLAQQEEDARTQRIYQLQGARGRLVFARDDLEKKIGEVEENIRRRESGLTVTRKTTSTLQDVKQARG